MIKSIFFPVLSGRLDRAGLDAACVLARAHQAHVVAVICISAVTPVPAAWSYYPLAVYETLSQAAQATSSRLHGELSEALQAADVSHEVRVSDTIWMTTSEMAAVQARYCDITVMARDPEADAVIERNAFSDLLLQSGRPLLLLPAGAVLDPDGLAVIAWKPTREATRALHDALPLLRRARGVQVALVEPKIGDQEHGELPGADVAQMLVRHGLEVEVVTLPRIGEPAGAVLVRHAQDRGAGLLVAGGYGHRRMREQVFGGVTRRLFEQATVPVLFSH